ncbi:hypothetical protein AVEN_207211-1, partial [Araneus ventricosus]
LSEEWVDFAESSGRGFGLGNVLG